MYPRREVYQGGPGGPGGSRTLANGTREVLGFGAQDHGRVSESGHLLEEGRVQEALARALPRYKQGGACSTPLLGPRRAQTGSN